MTRNKHSSDDLGRLVLAAGALIALLLLLRPEGNPFGLTLTLVGIVIAFLAVFYALSVLLGLALEAIRKAIQPEETSPGEAPAVEVPVETAAEVVAEAVEGEAPPEPEIKIEFGQGGHPLSSTPPPPVQARPGGWPGLRDRALGWLETHPTATVLIAMAAIFVLVAATTPGGPLLEQRLLEVSLALVLITLLAYALLGRAPVEDQTKTGAPEGDSTIPGDRATADQDPLSRLITWGVNLVKALWSVIEALLMMFVKTATTILPTSARLGDPDKVYNRETEDKMIQTTRGLGLDKEQEHVMISRWIDQITWVNNRANRERDANELIRWWQIILSASIPLIGLLPEMAAENKTLLASLAGALVTVLTAMQQFRRPEERWQHYRTLAENMQTKFWDFISLNEETYKDILHDKDGKPKFAPPKYRPEVYQAAFERFTQEMTRMRVDDVKVFFSQVVSSSTTAQTREEVAQVPVHQAASEAPHEQPDAGVDQNPPG